MSDGLPTEHCGMKVLAASWLDNGSRCLILLDWMAGKGTTFENLLCIEHDGSLARKAELPDRHDRFVEFQLLTDELVANTWNGWRLRLELTTGRIIDRQFVK